MSTEPIVNLADIQAKQREMVANLKARKPDIKTLLAELEKARQAGFEVDEKVKTLKEQEQRIDKIIRVYDALP